MTALQNDTHTRLRMTADEFLRWDSGDDIRYELIAGEVWAQASPADPHGTMMITLGSAMRTAVRENRPGCRIVAQPGIRSAIKGDETVREADLAMTCAPQTGSAEVRDPQIIVEIVSPGSGEQRDKAKVTFYQAPASVQVIVLLYSRKILCEVWRRHEFGWSKDPEILESLNQSLDLPEIGLSVTLADLYEDAI
jgi:Uma2 family endonuclease